MRLPKRSLVTIQIVDNKTIKNLNNKFLGKNYPTDVLSFNLSEKMPDKSFYLGEIIISRQKAREQAKKLGHSFEEELAELVKHGLFHLLDVHHT